MPAVGDMRQPRGTAFTIRDPLPWPDVAAIVHEGEELGYAAVFLPETGTRDTLATLNGIAEETDRLLLGTGVIPMGARTSRLAAMAAATVQERSGGRHILGVGTGGSAPGALGRLEEYVQEIRDLVGGSAPGAALRLPLPAPVPIWIAALGPKAVRLAGEIADGVILNWCTPDRVAEARTAIRVAAGEAGRDPDAVTIAVYVRASFSDRADEALLAAAAEYVSYPAYARQFEAMGVEPSPEAVVEAVCLRGDPNRAREHLEAYRGAGADLPVVYPVLAPGEGGEAALAVLRTFSI
ncbi:MAG TPA: LLM class flavin-dependent oxidoreductase [Actinomycetota bacterium]|nr:LLM class flavin-dependent oxidoreductase [Actinomycetota bacterium]